MPPIMKIDQFDNAGNTMTVIGCSTPAEIFVKFMPDVLLAKMFFHTNDKIIILRNKCKRQNNPTFKDLTLIGFHAFLGILIMTGARKDNHLTSEEMFSKSQGCPFYSSVMSERRFSFIQRALLFDSLAIREERVKTDKFVAISSLWDQIIANYEPSGHLTVEEQLLAFRGQCAFRIYIPNKQEKYGIKLVMACDAETYYMYNEIP
ncbi:piggyBac transposable element-derived protein 4-like [Palaemon carinicauda]|uniref:piggyBac transposable element-derived protein 4-like n=1 Tax=Palaemon carinicauda TaxID=392227 RepID=UPI0035B5ED2C